MKVVLFPGQGTQRAAMLSKIMIGPYIEDLRLPGLDLPRLLTDIRANVDSTKHAQPTLVAAGYIAYRDRNLQASFGIGHSVGEYTALCAAGCISLSECLRLVSYRAALMQECSSERQGMSLLLTRDWEAVQHACDHHNVSIASYNSPTRVVVSGLKTDVTAVCSELKVKHISLRVSGAFHSPFMRRAAEELARYIDDVHWSCPEYPVVSNLTAAPFRDVKEIKSNLISSITRPVLLHQSLEYVARLGCKEVVDIASSLK